jgi:pimeloyl-ACP methyl ester carboxylesterase
LSWGDAQKPTLVLLHGGGSNAHWWDHLAPQFAKSHYVVALDFRGHGVSEYPEELVVGGFNDDLEMLLEHLGTEDVAIVGHSMGCHVAVDHASRHPKTRALGLIDISRGATPSTRRRSRLALRLRRTYESKEKAIARFQFLPEASHAAESLRLSVAEHSVRLEDEGRWSFCFDPRWFTIASRPAPDCTKIFCPTLILRGAESTILSDEGARSLANEVEHSELIVIEGAGHHIHIDRPEATLAALLPFLETVAS